MKNHLGEFEYVQKRLMNMKYKCNSRWCRHAPEFVEFVDASLGRIIFEGAAIIRSVQLTF